MNTMSMPGFTAAASLHGRSEYRAASEISAMATDAREVTPQQFLAPDPELAGPGGAVAGPLSSRIVFGTTIRCCQYSTLLGRFVCTARVARPYENCQCVRMPPPLDFPVIRCSGPIVSV